MRRDGSHFGVLCALDPKPSSLTEDVFRIFNLLASLIAFELEADERRRSGEAELAEEHAVGAARERFMGAITHDLRTPLTAIKATAQMVLRTAWLPAEARPDVRLIVDSSNRIAGLVSDLLDFTRGRIGSGMPVQLRPTDVGEMCRQLIGEVQSAYPERVIALTVQGNTEAAVDPVRFGQAISNLVSNALQHSRAGSAVHVRLEGSDAGLLFEVHNAGAIAVDALGRIFDPFRRAQTPSKQGGLGLGLYIVRQIVEAHRGAIEVTSTPAEGTTFSLRLPVR